MWHKRINSFPSFNTSLTQEKKTHLDILQRMEPVVQDLSADFKTFQARGFHQASSPKSPL